MISVVIPSYNRKDCIVRLLRDLYAQEGVELEVVVVDDCSPDDSVAAIREEFPQVVLLVNESNGGPCVTRNRGVLAASGEIVVGLDSDVSVPDRRLLAKVEEAFKGSPGTTGLAFRILGPDGVSDDVPRWWHPVPVESGRGCRFETDYFSGTAHAFRRGAMIEAGLYPEILYMHYEEVVLAYRVLDRGGSISYRPDLLVVHHADPVSRRSEVQVFYKPRNQVLLVILCYPLLRGLCYLIPRFGFGLLKALANGHAGAFVRAMGSAARLAGRCGSDRRPLASKTWRRIAGFRREPVAGTGDGTRDGSATGDACRGSAP